MLALHLKGQKIDGQMVKGIKDVENFIQQYKSMVGIILSMKY